MDVNIIAKRKEDIYKKARRFERCYNQLNQNNYFKIKENNKLIKIYIDAKWNGYFHSIVYNVNDPKSTLLKNLEVLLKIESIISKHFALLTQQDIDGLQRALNDDIIYTHIKKAGNNKISYAYKLDIIRTLKQFWEFYIHYCENELKIKDVPNIVKYLRLKKVKKTNEKILFIKKEEVDIIVQKVGSQQMKAFFSVFFETGARVVEMLKLRMNNCSFDENKKVWIVRLPNEKGNSTDKMPIELAYSALEFSRWMQIRKDNPGEYVFQYSYDYVKNRLYELCNKYLNRHLTLKHFRKGTTMFLINIGAPEQYIKAHMGWSASSDAINNYINQVAIKRPDVVSAALKNQVPVEVFKENDELRLKQKIQEEQMKKLIDEIAEMKREQIKVFEQMNNIDIGTSRNMLRAVFEEMKQ